MNRFDHLGGASAGVILTSLLVILAAVWSIHSPAMPVKAETLVDPKPVRGWFVCRDLGIGPVPGLHDRRQRLMLCHPSGWGILTYCIQVGLPVPQVGRSCTRISEDTYRCGAGNQQVREYRTLQMPVDTPTPTNTPTQTPTPTLTPTPIPTRPVVMPTPAKPPRVPPGGEGNSAQLGGLILIELGISFLSAFLGIGFVRWIIKRG